MLNIITCKTLDGKKVEFVNTMIGSGSMKEVYFAPDKSYVVAFYKKPPDTQAQDRLRMITGQYRDSIFNQIGGDYWQRLFCWPTALVEYQGQQGIVAPTYSKHFFFTYGSRNNDMLNIQGKEKEGKWFASANLRNRLVDPRELGDWLNHLKIGLLLARAVRRMHMAGLAHSDLSYKNVLIDPSHGLACVIDIDGLVVPGKYPPDVVGTPDFIAPEVIKTAHLAKQDSQRYLPCRDTDLHALAVLIYMYLLYRHPLRGGKIHDLNNAQEDERLAMGAAALFIENPTDLSNRIHIADIKSTELPWLNTDQLPLTLTGPYLAPLFMQAFIDGLHNPAQRPSANDWETALVKTIDLTLPCLNPHCEQRWYVFDNRIAPTCPFCGTAFRGQLPVLNLYSSRQAGVFRPDNHRLLVWPGQKLFAWHVNSRIAPNEKLTDVQKKRVGYFEFHCGRWRLVNENMPGLLDVTDKNNKKKVIIGDALTLRDQQQIILDQGDDGRLIVVQIIEV
ncbi:helix-hairpin-helix domain-containing protein [Thiospirillum jenense]|uniref:Kinase n=1 Tax=Thiospirillum jenense TaxID=1653858 RepID=A0A839HD45_9GAMM|nr:kinase [Thiospirillum jenense]MBB1126434.1 kinase [Thiospirillum jenense]